MPDVPWLFRCGYVHALSSYQLRIAYLGLQPDSLEASLPLSLRKEREPVLVLEAARKLIQKRSERNRRFEPLKVGFPTRLIRKPRQVALRNIDSPKCMSEMASARGVD